MPEPDFSNALAAERPASAVNLTERPEDTAHRFACQLTAIRELHAPFGIYEPCEHGHGEDDLADGTAVDCGDFTSCPAGFQYWACAHCCTADGYQTEDCATLHEHGAGRPRCMTAAILDGSDDA